MPIILQDYLAKTWTYRKQEQDQLKLTLLAAGLGKRMDPIPQRHLPKPMFPLGGAIPIAELWVRRAVESGITDISMNLCVLKDTIKSYFKDGLLFGANITYVEEDHPTGTLGGVCKQALGRAAKEVYPGEIRPAFGPFQGRTILAPSGDIVTNFDSALLEELYELHRSQGAAFTMLLTPIPWERRQEFGTVSLAGPSKRSGLLSEWGEILEFREKDANSPSNLNNASVYLIEMELLRELDQYRTDARMEIQEPFYDFGKHVFPAMLGNLSYVHLSRKYPLLGVRYDGLWFDVGRKRDYLEVHRSLLDGEIDVYLPYKKLPWGYLGTNVVIDFSEVTIIPPVIIGHECVVERGAVLGPYAVIGAGWTIEQNARIRHSVLWERYPFYTERGEKISVRERKLVDRHEIRRGTVIDSCIVLGGALQPDLYEPGADRLYEKTVEVRENGELEFTHIDWVPDGPRL